MRHPARTSRVLLVAAVLSFVGVLVLGSRVVSAATATANLTVTATVIASCTVTAGTVAFGSYDPTASVNVDQSGTFTVACTRGTPATVGLGTGVNPSGAIRRMTNGVDFLAYELYKETGRTNVWGNTGGALVSLPAAPSNAPQTLTVFGRVAPGQNVGIGAYADTVVITVTF